MKNTIKNIGQAFKIIALAIILSLGLSYVYAWTAPSSLPPGGNTSAPLNTSSTGQTKTGGLILNTIGAPYGLSVAAGNVGMGTLNPSAKLDIRPDSAWLASEAVQIATVGQNPSLRLYRPTGTGSAAYPWYIQQGGGTNSSDLVFSSGSAAAIGSETVAPKVTITNGGNVGIGTTNPAVKLDVVGGLTVSGLIQSNSDTCVLGRCLSNAGHMQFFSPASGGGTFIVPSYVTTVFLTGVGGGGGGGGGSSWTGGGGGGAGGASIKSPYPVVPGTFYTVTVGGGGYGGPNSLVGGPGGPTSFGSLMSLGGGAPGQGYAGGRAGGAGGKGPFPGHVGQNGGQTASNGGAGGSSVFYAQPVSPLGSNGGVGFPATLYGGGGGGGNGNGSAGGAGMGGYLLIEW